MSLYRKSIDALHWNHYSEISQHELIKPLVFVDLDSFGCDRLIPVNLSRGEHSSYLVPIVNIKEPNLLTFRTNDQAFCQSGSNEMQMAERVINHFKDDQIILRQVSQEKPLNHFFQEMIEGTATEDDVASLVHC